MFFKNEVNTKAISSTVAKSESGNKTIEQKLSNGNFKHEVTDNVENGTLEIMDEGLYKYIGAICDHFQVVLLLTTLLS